MTIICQRCHAPIPRNEGKERKTHTLREVKAVGQEVAQLLALYRAVLVHRLITGSERMRGR